MGIAREHDLHRRRFSRNAGLGLVLAAFVGIIFGLTVVKVKYIDPAIMAQEVGQ
jgi:ABC-type nitrate/sulfonate/bicarbonate transport system permease component